MIPKIIHFVWVGNRPKPQLVLDCIDSWKKFCPDYEIREWNNDDVAKIQNTYVQEAFACKKWAFVSDYLRLYALNTIGGFYFDSDLELTHSIEEFRKLNFVTGYENWEGHISPITAFMGATQNHPIIKDLLSEYNDIHFIQNGQMNQTTNVTRISKYFAQNYHLNPPYDGTKKTSLTPQDIIYPWFYFCTPLQGQKNYSIHHFNGSWVDGYNRKTKLKLGKYAFVRFKKIYKTNTIPLNKDEKIVYRFSKNTNRFYAIIKRN